MDWILSLCLYLWPVLQASLAFNIDPAAWKYFSSPAAGFGYQVVQRSANSLLTSAPLEQYGDKRGQIYHCSVDSGTCSQIPITVPNHAVNMSLGLTMTKNPKSSSTLVCGPTIPRDCRTITTYNGLCLEIDGLNRPGSPFPASLEDCPSVKADVAFLLDGSGSVNNVDFGRMKDFVKSLIQSLVSRDTQFSVAQYSQSCQIHFTFSQFNSQNWESQIDSINQQGGGTFTAAAIQKVVNEVFLSLGGGRPDVKKILIVITDGQSHDSAQLSNAADAAERKSIVRFAIGVGSAFSIPSAQDELKTIASPPSQSHMFQVDSFEALSQIRDTLKNSIFTIEGSQTAGESLKMEMAQEGFSAAYDPEGGFKLGAVGAIQWKGGILSYLNSNQKPSIYQDLQGEPDSYLGYSMAVAKTRSLTFTIIGAPRFNHRGQVVILAPGKADQIITFNGQIGAYFGAEVCSLDLDGDSYSDVFLISAPMYKLSDKEGKVFVCTLSEESGAECTGDQMTLMGEEKGRFGTSLAPLPDLNNDGFNDLAVGAPLENDGQGSIYIFHGERGKIKDVYSQRILGSEVRSGLRFFGLSISQSSMDHSDDVLPDIAVGSKGAVVLLRSKPVVKVDVQVSFQPSKIPTSSSDCNTPLQNTAEVCFTMTALSKLQNARANIQYNLTLDARRKAPNIRAYFAPKNQKESTTISLGLGQSCKRHNFFIEACPEDALNSVHNELSFTFEGLSSSASSLPPSLVQNSQTTSNHPLDFEINCGSDDRCVDNLKVDFNFTSSSELKVGIDDVLNLTVSLESREEDSYNSRVILSYPAGLSYRRFNTLQGRVECSSLDSEYEETLGRSECTINKPIFKTNSQAVFVISYGIDRNSVFDSRVNFSAKAISGNIHSANSELFKWRDIAVKYSIYVLVSRVEDSTSFVNFTAEKKDLQKPVLQSFKVVNFARTFNLTVIIKVPMKLGEKDIWVNSNRIQIPGCKRGKDEEPTIKDFVERLKKKAPLDCTVASCGVFMCNDFVRRDDSNFYNISGNLSSGWIEQIGLKSAQFSLVSTATLDYDRTQYIFFSSDSKNTPPVQKIETYVEVFPEVDLTKEIVGGSLGGLALLALITAGLYKAGFFKSQYKQMMEDASDEAPGPEETNEAVEQLT